MKKRTIFTTCDVYKMYHCRGYPPGTTKIYSYLCARSMQKSDYALFFGLQYYLQEFLTQEITMDDVEEFLGYYNDIIGSKAPADMEHKFRCLAQLGYLPIEIKAVPEGTIIGNKNVLMTISNTLPEYYWLVGFLETCLLKIWAPISVATLSHKYKKLVQKFTLETSDSDFLLPFLVHDFSARGVSSEETAGICGAGHLVNFCGTDTVQSVKTMKNYYSGTGLIGASVSATEHALHCAWGPTEENELSYVERQLELNPAGFISVVSDAFSYWRMLTVTLPKVKDKILARDGKYVVRPDSGDPKTILCGTIKTITDIKDAVVEPYKGTNVALFELNGEYLKAKVDIRTNEQFVKTFIPTPEEKGSIRILDELFGSTVNSKGYKELNPKIGIIYGDGMFYERFKDILETMKEMNYANTNLVIGVGGLLVQQHNRDDLGFAFKATFATINGVNVELFKDPITDSGKRSHKGLMKLVKDSDGNYTTIDQVTEAEEKEGELVQVFFNGKITKSYTLAEIRERANN